MLLTGLLFIYLLVMIRLSIFHLSFLLRAYTIKKNGYALSKDKTVKVILQDKIRLLPLFLKSVFSIIFWPVDFLFAPCILLKAFILMDKQVCIDFSKYLASTNPFVTFK